MIKMLRQQTLGITTPQLVRSGESELPSNDDTVEGTSTRPRSDQEFRQELEGRLINLIPEGDPDYIRLRVEEERDHVGSLSMEQLHQYF